MLLKQDIFLEIIKIIMKITSNDSRWKISQIVVTVANPIDEIEIVNQGPLFKWVLHCVQHEPTVDMSIIQKMTKTSYIQSYLGYFCFKFSG